MDKAKADRIAGLQAYINSKKREIDGLLRDYEGVRPSWVSADLALAREAISRMERAIEEIMEEDDHEPH